MPDALPRPEPFAPQAAARALEDLRARLRATRWPDAPEDAGWSLGTDVGYLRELVAYWAEGFEWPAQEAALARFPRFRVRLGGLQIHFVHARAAGPAGPVLPLVLTHGWPDSFWRYTKVIGLLTDPAAHGADPADAFDVIVPDIPGFGYSDRPPAPALDAVAVAGLWAQLMTILGYPRFGAAGGDIGGHVSRYLALDHPDRVAAVHRTDAGAAVYTGDPADLAPEERAYRQRGATWNATEGAYIAMQATKPQTAAFGLTDSPAGLAAWIVEKFRAWSDCGGDVERAIGRDRMLADISLYWFTGAIGSSFWPYYARLHGSVILPTGEAITVPTGYAQFPREILKPPRSAASRVFKDIRRWSVMERGGHFAALEQPELLAGEVRAFFRELR